MATFQIANLKYSALLKQYSRTTNTKCRHYAVTLEGLPGHDPGISPRNMVLIADIELSHFETSAL